VTAIFLYYLVQPVENPHVGGYHSLDKKLTVYQ